MKYTLSISTNSCSVYTILVNMSCIAGVFFHLGNMQYVDPAIMEEYIHFLYLSVAIATDKYAIMAASQAQDL